MKKEKYGLESHEKRFATEEDCEKYLESVLWEDNRPICPKCKNNHLNYFLSTRKMYKCRNCKYHFNVKSNTIFMKTRLSLRLWFKAAYLMNNLKRGVPSTIMAELLEVPQCTAYYLMQKLRATHSNEGKILSGLVYTDETLVGADTSRDLRLRMQKLAHEEEQNKLYGYSKKRRYSIQKQLKKEEKSKERIKEFNAEQKLLQQNGSRTPWRPQDCVLGIYSANGELILVHLGKQYIDGTTENIEEQLRKYVDFSKSILITDQSDFYKKIGLEFLAHQTVAHGRNYVDKKTKNNTNAIENVFMHLNKMIKGTYFQISYGHLEKYLNEQAFRWNNRDASYKERFDAFMEGIIDNYQSRKDIVLTQKKVA